MATMMSMVANGNEHMAFRRASSVSTAETKSKGANDQMAQSRSRSSISSHPERPSAPKFRDLVMEYYGPGQRLREIYLASREGERVAVPITLAVQLSPRLREFVDTVMMEVTTRGGHDSFDKRRHTMNVPCSTHVLKTLVDYVTAKLELDLKLSEEGIRMTEEQKKEHWRDYIYFRVACSDDLDSFADDILEVAKFLGMKSLFDLMKCCFRLRL